MTRTAPTNLASALTPQGTNSALHDIKPPVAIPTGWEWLWWSIAVLLVAALAFWAWRHWRKRRSEAARVPETPVHIRARRRLEQALSLLSQPREFCIAVSDIVRWYLEERFDFRAPERTTEEFLLDLQATPLLKSGQKQSLGHFLESCDLVKFARYEPMETELRGLHGSAVRLVDETAPVEVVSAPGAHAEVRPETVPPSGDAPAEADVNR